MIDRNLIDRYVRPFYMSFLHGNLRWQDESQKPPFGLIKSAAREISDDTIQALLEEPAWRGRLTASWFVALGGRSQFIDQIGDLLIRSESVYSGQGYCLALGIIGGSESERRLVEYLVEYLPLEGRIYDQGWAVGALAACNQSRASRFLDAALWQDGGLSPQEGIDDFAELASYLRENRLIAP